MATCEPAVARHWIEGMPLSRSMCRVVSRRATPKSLLEVFTLLTWAAAALADAGRTPCRRRISKPLSASRRPCGHCVMQMVVWPGFMVAGAGSRGGWITRLPHRAGSRPGRADGLSMGYARLSAGRTSVIVDASETTRRQDAASVNAHAVDHWLLNSPAGRRPLVVNCGSGASALARNGGVRAGPRPVALNPVPGPVLQRPPGRGRKAGMAGGTNSLSMRQATCRYK